VFISYWDRKSLRLTLLTNLPQHSWASSHYPRIPALCGQKLVLPEVGLWVNPLRKLTINRSTSIAWVDEPRLICFTLRRITSITSRLGPIRPRSLRPSFLVLSCKSRVASPFFLFVRPCTSLGWLLVMMCHHSQSAFWNCQSTAQIS